MPEYTIVLEAESSMDIDADQIHDEFMGMIVDVGDYNVTVVGVEVRQV